ncbi:MAG: hypothetical protein CMG00_07915 [Candidatus Marinimicrobia bacterium]|nr:hypothetical protein [Candidatus Neomarinimicrobiota bacterium]|tara:strand:+ start:1158 stop:1826 length:669 start_codon:yes stop_codon:yes gene_type:complete
MIKRLAIIPARSGSKRIKNKNIIGFYGKPLLSHSLEIIKKSKMFKKIHVSTDSNKIKKIASSLKIETDFFRPSKLSGDNVSIIDTLKFVVNNFKKRNMFYDQIWLFYATNPFIKIKYIKDANKLFLKHKQKNPILPVTKYNYPVEWALKIKRNVLHNKFKNLSHLDSRMTEKLFCDAGMFCVYGNDHIFKNKSYVPYEIPIHETVDIDDKDDLKLAKKLFRK